MMEDKKEYALKVIGILEKTYPEAKVAF